MTYSRAGLTLTAEDFAFKPEAVKLEGNIAQKSLQVLGETYDKWFSDPLFRRVIPALKVNYADEIYKDLVTRGLSEEAARKQAATTANTMFGGVNVDELMRSKETQNIFRSLILAPDWLETNVKIAKNLGKSLFSSAPKLQAYRTFARNLVGMYLIANVTNKVLSGHWMFQNEGNNKFNIDTGSYTENGKKRYFRPFGTAIDFVRVPFDAVTSLAQKNLGAAFDPLANRLSMPVSAGMHLLANNDYKDRPIYGKNMDLSKQAGGITNEVLGAVGIPSQIRTGVDYGTGRISGEEALVQLAEFPIKYQGGAYSDASQKKLDTLKTAGLAGEQLYTKMQTNKKDEGNWFTNLFSNQKEESMPSDPLLKSIYLQNKGTKQKNRIKEIFNMGLEPTEIQKVLDQEGLGDYETASLSIISDLGVENGIRPDYLKGVLKPLTGEEFAKKALFFAENSILTNNVVSYWLEKNEITDQQADYLKWLIKQSKADTKKVKTGRIKLKTPPKFTSKAPKLTPTTVNAPAINFDIPTVKSVPKLTPINILELRKQAERVRGQKIRR